eukprot:4333470-Pleurochrysis_carterae.AAC.2
MSCCSILPGPPSQIQPTWRAGQQPRAALQRRHACHGPCVCAPRSKPITPARRQQQYKISNIKSDTHLRGSTQPALALPLAITWQAAKIFFFGCRAP